MNLAGRTLGQCNRRSQQTIEFSAHRVFAAGFPANEFRETSRVDAFSCIDSKGDLVENPEGSEAQIQRNYGAVTGAPCLS